MKSIRRFTLVELLAVIALISILSAIGFGVYSYAKGKAQETATEALMKQIEAGLESFHAKAGYYPPSPTTGSSDSKKSLFSTIKFTFASDGTVSEIDFGNEKLEKKTGTDKVSRMKNERLEAFAKAVDMEVLKGHLDNDGDLTDAWGEKIYYCAPGEFKKGSYDLISAGPDGKFGKDSRDKPEDYRETGEIKIEKYFREFSGEHLCDDIFTF